MLSIIKLSFEVSVLTELAFGESAQVRWQKLEDKGCEIPANISDYFC